MAFKNSLTSIGPNDDPLDQALLDLATFVPDSQTTTTEDSSLDLFPFPTEKDQASPGEIDDPLGDIF